MEKKISLISRTVNRFHLFKTLNTRRCDALGKAAFGKPLPRTPAPGRGGGGDPPGNRAAPETLGIPGKWQYHHFRTGWTKIKRSPAFAARKGTRCPGWSSPCSSRGQEEREQGQSLRAAPAAGDAPPDATKPGGVGVRYILFYFFYFFFF